MLTREPQMPWESWTGAADRSGGCDASQSLYGQLILLAIFALAAWMRLAH